MIEEQKLSLQEPPASDRPADADDEAPGTADGAGYARPTESLSIPVLQAALEVERHAREWLEQALATRQAERDELRRELERLRGGHGPDGVFGDPCLELHAEVERLREALRASEATAAEPRERIIAATADAATLTSRVAELEAERCDLRRQLVEATSELNAVVLRRDALSRERDSLVREIQTLQEQQHDGRAAAPAAGSQPTAGDLGHSLELIAESVGALRTWSDEVRAGEMVPMTGMLVLEDRLRLLLAPLATLPELRVELARLGTLIAAISGGDGLPARSENASGASAVLEAAAERAVAAPDDTPAAPECRPCQEQQARQLRSGPRSVIFSRRDEILQNRSETIAE